MKNLGKITMHKSHYLGFFYLEKVHCYNACIPFYFRANQSTSSSEESSYSDEYDWSPAKTPPNHKVTNKENQLPGGWTLEELQNSPIRSFVPIWKQSDNEGFKTQFDKAKKRFEKQQLKGKGKRKQKGTKRKRGKRKSKKKPAAKRQRCTK